VVKVGNLSFMRGTSAEGTDIPWGTVFATFPADCYTVVVKSYDERVIAFHAGGRSTYDEQMKKTGKPSRKFASVVDAVIDRFKTWKTDIRHLKVFGVCGISPLHFQIDLPSVIREQFVEHGVLDENIVFDLSVETYDTCDWDGNPRFWSHERSKNEKKEYEAKNCRNLVLVVN
jgi:copper oxidase (laccase) domain-containing protein